MIRYVFVSGPYTLGDPLANVRKALEVGEALTLAGFVPFIPHLFHFWNEQLPNDYETWMELDFAWLEKCDAVLRIAGTSPGADREEEKAHELGIPVFYLLDQLIRTASSLMNKGAT